MRTGHPSERASGQCVVQRLQDACGVFSAEAIETGKVEKVPRDGDAEDARDDELSSQLGVIPWGCVGEHVGSFLEVIAQEAVAALRDALTRHLADRIADRPDQRAQALVEGILLLIDED